MRWAAKENYLADDGHVKNIRLPYVSIYNAVPPMVSVNNMGSNVLTFDYQ